MTFATVCWLVALSATEPLALPENFDPALNMPAKTTEFGTFHPARACADWARRLVANGTPEDLERAEKALDALLACQVRDARDPHCGNFRWMHEDEAVEDLNAVEFVLADLIPMMLEHGDRLPPALRDRVTTSIWLGLDEIRRLDVVIAYTNTGPIASNKVKHQ